MTDFAQLLFARTICEPYRVKVVERVRMTTEDEREEILRGAHYSPAFLKSEDVLIDLVTDSGTSAMSDEQWSALMRGDEAYVRSRNFDSFERAIQEITGFPQVIPTHQGRAAENIVMELLLEPGQMVLSNTLFDTTRAHIEHRRALPLDLVGDELWSFDEPHPFKGNFDLARLSVALERYADRVAFVVITVSNNLACSSPVSMQNIRDVRRLANRYGKRVFLDACRFAENAFFIKQREPGYATKSVREIALEMFSLADGCWMSAKKDALVNVGGFIAVHDSDFAMRCREKLVLYEGFYTYGGLARRDLEAVAVGMREGTDEAYLAHRTSAVAYLGEQLSAAGLVVSKPVGGSGVFVDVAPLYPQLQPQQLPGVALFADMYRVGGVRIATIPFAMRTVNSDDGELSERSFLLARFAVPRRVYTRSHLEYVGGVAAEVRRRAHQQRGFRVAYEPPVLGHFFSRFEPLAR